MGRTSLKPGNGCLAGRSWVVMVSPIRISRGSLIVPTMYPTWPAFRTATGVGFGQNHRRSTGQGTKIYADGCGGTHRKRSSEGLPHTFLAPVDGFRTRAVLRPCDAHSRRSVSRHNGAMKTQPGSSPESARLRMREKLGLSESQCNPPVSPLPQHPGLQEWLFQAMVRRALACCPAYMYLIVHLRLLRWRTRAAKCSMRI